MAEEFLDNWTTQLRKGLLEFCILNSLAMEKVYGYDIVRKLRSIEHLVVSEGTVYPILSRLKREGLVGTSLEESSEGPARKYYQLTPRGTELLSLMNNIWGQVLKGVQQIQSQKGAEQK
jgi:PadR family transcriptional regulator, regulatory protein PadR